MNLEQKYAKYLELIETQQDYAGFIGTHECDALLISALAGAAGVEVDITAALGSDDRWRRRPVLHKECWPDHSKSTISRDMFMGLAWYIWHHKRLDLSEQIIKYALSHSLKMGEGTGTEGLSRVFMSPSLLATYAWISYKLGGPNRWWLRWIPTMAVKKQTGFRAHLAVLHQSLRNSITGKANINDKLLQFYVNYDPVNPFYLALVGRYAEAVKVLMDERFWPNDRLPTSLDRKNDWITARESWTDNWLPDRTVEEKIWSGGDFLLCAAIILGVIK